MRRLAVFAYVFALGTLTYQYLLTPETILWGGLAVAGILLGGLLLKGEWRTRAFLGACALAAGITWSGLYELWLVRPAQEWDESVVTVSAEVTGYAERSGSGGIRIPVRLVGEELPTIIFLL